MAYITVFLIVNRQQPYSVAVSVPTKHRKLIETYAAMSPLGWVSGLDAALWLQLPGVVVESR